MLKHDWAITGTAAVLLAGVGAGVATLVSLTWTPEPELAELVERYDTMGLTPQRPDGVSSDAAGQAPTGTLAPSHASQKAKQASEAAPRSEAPPQTPSTPASDEDIASSAGVLGALKDQPQKSLDPPEVSGVGGLISSKGVGVGSSGLGGLSSRGVGLGGGGRAETIGGLGSSGHGYGASGYGRGGGSYGAGRGSVGSVRPGSLGAAGGLSRTQLGPGVMAVQEASPDGINGFVRADRDRLSTFAVDVDTGSYTLTRSLLRGGRLPAPRQVRVEEFINVMDYRLAPPTSGRVPFSVAAEGAPHPTESNHALLRVALKGAMPEPKAARLTFLVDTSCSMSDELPLVKQSLHVLVDHAGPEDSVAIATYAGGTRKVLDPTPTTRKQVIHDAIDSLTNGGGTAMDSGMQLAYDMADRAYLAGAENRVIVLSDGDANIGATTHEQILSNIAAYAGRGITLSAVGFGGANYRDGMMEQLADNGDGNYVYIDGTAEAERVFGEGLAATLHTIARDVKIQVAFDSDAVLAWRLIGYENRDVADEDFRNDAVDGGEIGAGHEVTALYELVLADELPEHIGQVYLRAKPPGPDAPAHEWTVPIRRLQLRSEWGDASDDLRLASGAALFAEKLRNSPYVEEISWEYLQAHLEPLPRSRQVVELRELVDRAKQLDQPTSATTLASAVPVPMPSTSTRSPMDVVRRTMPRLRYCYQRQLARQPDLAGTVDVEVYIDEQGHVTAGRTVPGTLTHPVVESCLVAMARRMRFARHQPQSLRFTLTFEP